MGEMGVLQRNYDFVDFNANEFPIPYDREDFPRGLRSVEIYYHNGRIVKASFCGFTGEVRSVSPNYLDTLLEFIDAKSKKLSTLVPEKTDPSRV